MLSLGAAAEAKGRTPVAVAEARRWYRRAADAGDPVGLTRLGLMMRDGIGGPVDRTRARALFRRAAEAIGLGLTLLGIVLATRR